MGIRPASTLYERGLREAFLGFSTGAGATVRTAHLIASTPRRRVVLARRGGCAAARLLVTPYFHSPSNRCPATRV